MMLSSEGKKKWQLVVENFQGGGQLTFNLRVPTSVLVRPSW